MMLASYPEVYPEAPLLEASLFGSQDATNEHTPAEAAFVAGSNSIPESGRIRQVISELELLNSNTEQDFLRIGGKLGEFIGAVEQISSGLDALANRISGEQGPHVSNALTHALNRSMEMSKQDADRSVALIAMRQQGGHLNQTLSEFQGTVSTFHTLGVLTRIETARLGGQGSDFGHLADDMQALAGNVREKVEGALETAAVLSPLIENAIEEISALEAGQAKDLPSVIAGVSASLSSFREIQKAALDSSVRLGVRYAAISDAFKELIVSVQFHDITRQQIEHVIEALRRICPDCEQEGGGSTCDRRGISSVLIVQSSQLADAGEKFAASAATVAHTLSEIAANVLELSGESGKLSGLSEDKSNSFFLEMEHGCSAILSSLGHCAKAEAATRASGAGLSETIRKMVSCIEEIRSIEAQMKRMALNAIIRAAQIGAPGAALGVVADSLRQGAYESGKRSKSLFESLHAMSDAAARLCLNSGSASVSERDCQDDCLEEMRAAVGELHSSSERSFAQIAQIVDSGNRLRENLSVTREDFTVGSLFADAVSRARGMLKGLEEKNEAALPGEATAELELGLADHAMRYTMQSERDVHESVTKALAGTAPAAGLLQQTQAVSVEADGLGENVEFF